MITFLATILVFGVLVTVHELGHFITAKMTGMLVEEFAIGFGPSIYSTQSGETKYSLRLIPLGGYNKIAGMDPDEEPNPRGFSSKSVWSRMLVILAGSIMNLILPMILFAGLFFFNGQPKVVDEPIIGTVIPNQAAATAGIMPEDRILSIDGEKITSWNEVRAALAVKGKDGAKIEIQRANNIHVFKVNPVFNEEVKRSLIGIAPKVEQVEVGLVDSLVRGVTHTKNMAISMVEGLFNILTGNSPAEVAGPIGVAKLAGEVAGQGILPLISFMAMLSINLAVINLMPIPALDGGHFLLLVVEAVRGKALPPALVNRIQMLGVAIILSIVVFSTFKDITRW